MLLELIVFLLFCSACLPGVAGTTHKGGRPGEIAHSGTSGGVATTSKGHAEAMPIFGKHQKLGFQRSSLMFLALVAQPESAYIAEQHQIEPKQSGRGALPNLGWSLARKSLARFPQKRVPPHGHVEAKFVAGASLHSRHTVELVAQCSSHRLGAPAWALTLRMRGRGLR
eukprot:2133797-Amphidinium_carterae.1